MDKEVLIKSLQEGFTTLSYEEKIILQLFYYEDLSMDEICDVMSIDHAKAGIYLSTAKTKMKSFTSIFEEIDKIGQRGLAIIKQ